MKKIYINFKKPNTIDKLLKLIYSKKFPPSTLYSVNTYYDKDCKQLQCNKGWRSFDDLYCIVKTYFPSTTEKILMTRLLKYRHSVNNTIYKMHFGHCDGAGILRVMPYYIQPAVNYYCITNQKMKNSNYTWVQLFGLLNLHDSDDVKKYLKNIK